MSPTSIIRSPPRVKFGPLNDVLSATDRLVHAQGIILRYGIGSRFVSEKIENNFC